MNVCEDWETVCEKAHLVVEDQMRLKQDQMRVSEQNQDPGLRPNQYETVRHVLRALAHAPGMIVAERTGQGKSLIAIAIMAALARVRAQTGAGPLRVGLLAPNQDVLTNWVESSGSESDGTCLLAGALDKTEEKTYLWKADRLPWRVVCPRLEIEGPDTTADLHVFADHYSFGITHGYGKWGKDAEATRVRARAFVGGGSIEPLDLLIIDEAHQLKSSRSDRAAAIRKIFGGESPAIPVRRVLLLTATPFQLRAAPELARLVSTLRCPHSTGVDFPPELRARMAPQALADLFDRYQRVVARWLGQRMAKLPADQSYEAALKVKEDVESVLRQVMVRSNTPVGDVVTKYGQPNHELANELPDPAAGLSCETTAERLLFLAWDGSIASRTTFVASEQQTLTSSVCALRSRQEKGRGTSAVEQKRRPLAPAMVDQALFSLSRALGKHVHPDHVKVRATVEAIRQRLAQHRELRPVLVFAERTATLELLKHELTKALPDVRVELIYGGTSRKQRCEIVKAFKCEKQDSCVHVVLASKVAEMGLDIDGPENKEDIWLIHHDFPWNPAMVDQRNGRVLRGAKGDQQRRAYITYPFIKDTVDERIFKRMLARQAMAELLLGTDDVARALRLTDQSNLDDIDISDIRGDEFRKLTPDLSPRSREFASPPQDVDAAGEVSEETVATETVVPVFEQTPSGTGADPNARPSWCSSELLDLVAFRVSAPMSHELRARVLAMAADLGIESWSNEEAAFARVDLVGRRQTVAAIQHDDRVVCLSLADTVVDDDRILEAFALNAEPGVAGLLLMTDSSGEERLVARAANLSATLDDRELRRLLLETGRRADEWEARYYGEDQW